jgi:hypothetical protein
MTPYEFGIKIAAGVDRGTKPLQPGPKPLTPALPKPTINKPAVQQNVPAQKFPDSNMSITNGTNRYGKQTFSPIDAAIKNTTAPYMRKGLPQTHRAWYNDNASFSDTYFDVAKDHRKLDQFQSTQLKKPSYFESPQYKALTDKLNTELGAIK